MFHNNPKHRPILHPTTVARPLVSTIIFHGQYIETVAVEEWLHAERTSHCKLFTRSLAGSSKSVSQLVLWPDVSLSPSRQVRSARLRTGKFSPYERHLAITPFSSKTPIHLAQILFSNSVMSSLRHTRTRLQCHNSVSAASFAFDRNEG